MLTTINIFKEKYYYLKISNGLQFNSFKNIFRTLHLYVAANLDYIGTLLMYSKTGTNSTKEQKHDQKEVGSDVWLIFLPQIPVKTDVSFSNIFKSAPLQLDSFVFAFYETNKGKVDFFLNSLVGFKNSFKDAYKMFHTIF